MLAIFFLFMIITPTVTAFQTRQIKKKIISILSMNPERPVRSYCICRVYVDFVCNAWELYQGGERGQIHADSDHTAGES